MARRFLLTIIIFAITYGFSVLGHPHDRAPLINRADSLIPGILDFLSNHQGFIQSLTVEERQQFEGLLGVGQVRRQFSGSYHGRFAFLRNGPKTLPDSFGDTVPQLQFFAMMGQPEDNFVLNPGEDPRSAKTHTEFHSNILFNPAIMNSAAAKIGLFETVSIMIHEYGHKIIVGKNQQAIDSVAVKILQALKPYHIRKSLNGTDIEILSIPIRLSARVSQVRAGLMGTHVPLIIHTGSQSIDALLDVTSAVANIRQLAERSTNVHDEIVIRLGKIELSAVPYVDGEPEKIHAKVSFQFVNEFNHVTKELDPLLQIRRGRGFYEFKDQAESLFNGSIGQFDIETTLTIPKPRKAGSLIFSPVVEVSTPRGVRIERDAGISIQIKSWETTHQGLQFELTGNSPKMPLYLEMQPDNPDEPPLLLEAVEILRRKGSVKYAVKIPWMSQALFKRFVWPNMKAILDVPLAAQQELQARSINFPLSYSEYPPFIERVKVDAVNLLDRSGPPEFLVQLLVESDTPLDYVDLRWVHGFDLYDTKNYNRDESRLGHFGFMSHERIKVLSDQPLGRFLRLITVKSTGGAHMILPKLSDSRFRFFSSGTRRLISATVINKNHEQNTITMTAPAHDLRPITKPGDHWAIPTRRGSPFMHPDERLKICLYLFN